MERNKLRHLVSTVISCAFSRRTDLDASRLIAQSMRRCINRRSRAKNDLRPQEVAQEVCQG